MPLRCGRSCTYADTASGAADLGGEECLLEDVRRRCGDVQQRRSIMSQLRRAVSARRGLLRSESANAALADCGEPR